MKNNTGNEQNESFENNDSFFISDELSGILEYNLHQYNIQKEQENQKRTFDYLLKLHKSNNSIVEIPIKFLEFSADNLYDYKKSLKNERYYKVKIIYDKEIKITDLFFIKKLDAIINENNQIFNINFLDYSFDLENKIITVKELSVDA